jgi:hypothetical protein
MDVTKPKLSIPKICLNLIAIVVTVFVVILITAVLNYYMEGEVLSVAKEFLPDDNLSKNIVACTEKITKTGLVDRIYGDIGEFLGNMSPFSAVFFIGGSSVVAGIGLTLLWRLVYRFDINICSSQLIV